MSLWNVSMVMAPNLFARCNHGNKRSIAKQQEEMEEAVGGANLIQLMVRHQDLLWTVSLDIHMQEHSDINVLCLTSHPVM